MELGIALAFGAFALAVALYLGLSEIAEAIRWKNAARPHRARAVPEEQRIQEAFAAAFCNMDENGDPVGAKPDGPWETGYAAGLRTVYRTLKARGIALPSSQPQDTAAGGEHG